MKQIIRKLLTEAVDVSNDLQVLTDAFGNFFEGRLKDTISIGSSVRLYLDTYHANLKYIFRTGNPDIDSKIKTPQLLSREFDSERLYISLKDGNSGSTSGSYSGSQRLMVIYIPKKLIEKYFEQTDNPKIHQLVSEMKKTFIHELRHLYDNRISDGKAFGGAESEDFRKRRYDYVNKYGRDDKFFLEDDNFEQYVKFHYEIAARFEQFLKDNKMRFYNKSFKDVVHDLKMGLMGWHYLSEKDQKKLIRRTSQYYYALNKNKKNVDKIFKLWDQIGKRLEDSDLTQHISLSPVPIGEFVEVDTAIKSKQDLFPTLIRYAEIHKTAIYIPPHFPMLEHRIDTLTKLGFKKGDITDKVKWLDLIENPEEYYVYTPKSLKTQWEKMNN